MYVNVYVCIYSSLNIAMIDHVWMVSKGAKGKQGHGRCMEDSVLYNFLKQNCLFEIPKTFSEEGLQSPPQNVPKMCCIYSSRGFHTPDAA